MRVKVYFNLHKNLFSVQHKGIVIAHKTELSLRNAQFKVRESGRRRVLQEKRKNVHAFVIGELVEYSQPNIDTVDVTYNPYLYNSFVCRDNHQPIHQAGAVWLKDKTIKALLTTSKI